MTNVWDFFRNLFREAEQSSSSRPLIHESFQRTEEELAALSDWEQSPGCRRIMDWIGDQYSIWQVLPHDTDHAIDFLDTPSSKGFAIHFDRKTLDKKEVVFLFDYLKKQVLTLDYKSQHADTRTWSEKKFVTTVDRYYLKPRPAWDADQKFRQQYGNITIELEYRNDLPYRLKFRATHYHDRLYGKPDSFRELMQVLLG